MTKGGPLGAKKGKKRSLLTRDKCVKKIKRFIKVCALQNFICTAQLTSHSKHFLT